jgi:hypothetical protein
MRTKTPNEPTSLWAVIDSMQRKLETEGLDSDVVDAAVIRGMESLLRRRDGAKRTFSSRVRSLLVPALPRPVEA